ncbi:MAG: hypothetical protein P4L03_04105 [Terracidiphilus sp.]|nr:hypothetical protein [Terracidiphilus sp.]
MLGLTDDNTDYDRTPDNPPDRDQSLREQRAEVVIKRYRDGYSVARIVNGIGIFFKIVAGVLAALLLLAIILVLYRNIDLDQHISSFGSFPSTVWVLIVFFNLVTCGILFFLGILIQANGQSMKARFDSAVHSSPFLNDNQRAEVMSLD